MADCLVRLVPHPDFLNLRNSYMQVQTRAGGAARAALQPAPDICPAAAPPRIAAHIRFDWVGTCALRPPPLISDLCNGITSVFDWILLFYVQYAIYDLAEISEADVRVEYKRSLISSEPYQWKIHGFG